MTVETEKVEFNPAACGIILREAIEDRLDPAIWEPFQTHKGFHQDKFPVEAEGVIYPPTFNWISMITARRRRDKEFFYVRLTIAKTDAEAEPFDLDKFIALVDNAIRVFNTFSDCECKVGFQCAYHDEVLAHGLPPESE